MSLYAYHGRVRTLVAGGWVLLWSGIVACGAGPDSWPEGRPQIDRLEFLQQSSLDPWSLQFLVAFTDTNGDLGQGTLEMMLGGETKATQPVAEVFRAQTPEIPIDATSGEFEVLVKIASEVPVGEEIEVGFVLQDGQGERSNEPSVTLRAFAPGGGD